MEPLGVAVAGRSGPARDSDIQCLRFPWFLLFDYRHSGERTAICEMVSANPKTSVNRWLFSCKSLRFCISVEVMKSWELVFDRLVFGKLLNHGPCFPGEETLDDDELEPLQRVWRCASRFYSRRRIRLSESNASSLRSRSRTGRSHSGLGWKLATRSGMLIYRTPLNVSPCLVLSFIIANKSRTQLQCYICGSTAIILLRVSFRSGVMNTVVSRMTCECSVVETRFVGL